MSDPNVLILDEVAVMIPEKDSAWERDGRLLHVSALLSTTGHAPGTITVTTRERSTTLTILDKVGQFVCRIEELPEHLRRYVGDSDV